MTRPKPVVLCILDGWGYRPETQDNAIALATTPTWDRLWRDYPHALIETSGMNVGLPDGQMGNSEVGHMNLGAGRVVMQDLPRIDTALDNGYLDTSAVMNEHIAALKESGGACHLMGLLSPGGVHSHQRHMAIIARHLHAHGVPVIAHAFLDGRDTPPQSAKGYVAEFLDAIKDLPGVTLATVSGRYYAMDRDKRWDRVELAYNALVNGKGQNALSAESAIEASYRSGKTDEFVLPTVIGAYKGMKDGDGLLMFNFRTDRSREILAAIGAPGFHGFHRSHVPTLASMVGMVEYSTAHADYMRTLFPHDQLTNLYGQVVAKAGLTQLRIAETEKYAHVTFFFNGGEEQCFPGEERILIPSPRVATYDLKPEMAALEVTDKLVFAIENRQFDTIIVNYANGDMVGHTGILDAAIKAAETLDSCLSRLEKAILKVGGVMLITADHGNCEMMRDPVTGEPHTAHTTGAVPAILVNAPADVSGLEDGRLADVAPTLLRLIGLEKPAEMDGRSLLVERRHRATA